MKNRRFFLIIWYLVILILFIQLIKLLFRQLFFTVREKLSVRLKNNQNFRSLNVYSQHEKTIKSAACPTLQLDGK